MSGPGWLPAMQARFDGVTWLYLQTLHLGGEGDLQIVADEASAESEAQPLNSGHAAVDRVFGPAFPITTRPGHRRFTLRFEGLAAFAMRDEGHAQPEPVEDYSCMFRHYDRSAFLDFVRRGTIAEQIDGPVTHVAVVTLDQVIDIACHEAPVLTVDVLTRGDLR